MKHGLSRDLFKFCLLFVWATLVIISCAINPRENKNNILHPFSSDGCSLFPDGFRDSEYLWCECCFIHDIAYWKGGTEAERYEADQQLKECVFDKTKDQLLAEMVFAGVRAGGEPEMEASFSWGYGWKQTREYSPLSDREKKLSEVKLSQIDSTIYCKD